MTYPELKKCIVEQEQQYQPDVVLIEDKSSGQALIQDIQQESTLPIIACCPTESKIIRFSKILPLIEAGKLYLLNNTEWLEELETELFSFPNSVHDDQVDSISQAVNWATKNKLDWVRVRRL